MERRGGEWDREMAAGRIQTCVPVGVQARIWSGLAPFLEDNHINFNHNQSSHHKCLAGIFVMNEVTLAANNISTNRKLCLKSDKNSTLCIAVAKTAEEFKTIISFIP